MEAFVFAPPTLPGAGGGLPISLVIQSTGAPEQVFEIAEEVRLRPRPAAASSSCRTSLAFDAPQLIVTIDRERAAALNVPVSEIGSTLSLLVGGGSISQFDRDSNSYDVITQVPRESRANPEQLGELLHPRRRRARWCR